MTTYGDPYKRQFPTFIPKEYSNQKIENPHDVSHPLKVGKQNRDSIIGNRLHDFSNEKMPNKAFSTYP